MQLESVRADAAKAARAEAQFRAEATAARFRESVAWQQVRVRLFFPVEGVKILSNYITYIGPVLQF